MRLFISYAPPDRPKVDLLARQLRPAGHDFWYDSNLVGGQAWWDRILGALFQCDAVVAVVSQAYLESKRCYIERQYAMQLGKAALLLAIDWPPSGVIPPDMTLLQIIDYSQPEAAAHQLTAAIMRLPAPLPLPDPLPPPPSPPSVSLTNIADQLAVPELTPSQQFAIIEGLEDDAISPRMDPADWPAANELLSQMLKHSDLHDVANRRIADLQRRLQFLDPSLPAGPSPRAPAFPQQAAPPPRAPAAPQHAAPPPSRQPTRRRNARGAGPARRHHSAVEQPDDPVSRAVKAAVTPGLLIFNPPAEMIQGRKERVEVGIARSPELREALVAGLQGRGEPKTEGVDTSSFMGVELKGDSFKVTSLSSAEQLVAPMARWEFDVLAFRAGQQTIALCVTMRIDSPITGGRIAVPVLEKQIKIRVDVGYGTRRFLAANWQWLIATTVGLGGALIAWITLIR